MSKQSPLDDPKAASLLNNKAALESLMKSPDTKRLMELLNRNAGGGLKTAAEAAMKGNTTQLVDLMNQVMKDPEGAKVVENLNRSVPK